LNFINFKEVNEGPETIYVIATTNMPWELDIAVIRRFERRLLLPVPDSTSRIEICQLHLGKIASILDKI
jgi:vacuolar protein-sorting-associated protein 4